jgi:hypothetical protein
MNMDESKITIQTNFHWYEPLYYFQLPKKWQKEYRDLKDSEKDELQFFIYRKWCYRLDDFVQITNPHWGFDENAPEPFKPWDGYASDSFFSGVLIRYDRDCDRIQCATYFS